jgi:hypothetical protein
MREQEITPALTPEEWGEGFFRRGEVTGCGLDGDAVSLIRRSTDGTVEAVRLEGIDQRRAAAALALSRGGLGLDWQDHDDQLIASILLASYERGVPFAELGDRLQEALRGVLDRSGERAARIAALLPPRPEETA